MWGCLYCLRKVWKGIYQRNGKASLLTFDCLGKKKKMMEENITLKKRCPLVLLVGSLTLTEAHKQRGVLSSQMSYPEMSPCRLQQVTYTDPYGSLGCQISVRVDDICTHPVGTFKHLLKTLTLTESSYSELVFILIPGPSSPAPPPQDCDWNFVLK